jgi:hypothetical protein
MVRSCLVLLSVVSLLLLLPAAHAQNPTATLVGTVQDTSGAVIPGAAVVARNVATNLQRTALSGNNGEFTIPNLPPGQYAVFAEKEGFRRLEQTGIELQIDDTVRLTLQLQVGAVSESVEVKAEVPLINTANGTTGDVIVSREMTEMPLDGRDYTSLAYLVPGVTPNAQGGNSGNMNINGARPDNTNYLIDGFSNQNPRAGGALGSTPSLDTIQEFKMQTSNYSAEYGRVGGGMMNMVLKTGGNQIHGSLFEFFRNDALDARNFFDAGKSKLRRNQFGGTLSGPVYLPKLYSGRNRTFFLFSWESYRSISGDNQLGMVPTALEHQGDFSQSLDASRKLITVKDPLAGNAQFPGNKIPASRFDPVVAQQLMPMYPMPNHPGVNNYLVNANALSNWDSFMVKIDHRLFQQGTLSANILKRRSRSTAPFQNASSNLGTFGDITVAAPFLGGLRYTHVISPTLINETRFSANLAGNREVSVHQGQNWAKALGITGLTQDPGMVGFPRFNISGLGTMQLADNQSAPMKPTISTYEVGDTLTWVKGRHLFKFGGSYFRFQFFMPVNGNVNGQFNFTGAYTNNGLSDFLLGLVHDSSRKVGVIKSYMFSSAYGGFAQDDFKVTSRLTLNLGVRYDLTPPQYEKYGQYASFEPAFGAIVVASDKTVPNFQQLLSQFGLTGHILLAKEVGMPSSLGYTNYKKFAPRFGMAYRVSNKFVVRGGYGIFYGISMSNTLRRDLSNVFPYTMSQTFTATASNQAKWVTLSNPFPDALSSTGGTTSANGINPYARPQYLQQWNFTVERDLGKGIALETAYTGSKGTHLGLHYNLNQPFYVPSMKMSNGNFPRPYAFFNDITYYDFCANSLYNGGTITVRKRLARGAFFRANYTFAKSLDNASQFADNSNGSISGVQDSRDFMLDYGRADWDRRHAFTMNFVADLPYRQMFLPGMIGKTLLRGWQLSGSGTAYSGQAFTVTANSQSLNLGQANRPDRIAFGALPNPGPDAWYDIKAFPLVPTGAWRWGTSGRNILDGPPQMNLNFALMRNFRLGGESGRLQFRWEAFNATNHTNLRLPVITVNTANAATITSANSSRTMQFGLRYQF